MIIDAVFTEVDHTLNAEFGVIAIEKGTDSAYSEGFEAGKKAEYDAFWDGYQNNGIGGAFNYTFYSNRWTDDIYNPKYDLKCKGTCVSTYYASKITDTKVNIDASNATLQTFFTSSGVVTVRKLIVNENTKFVRTFESCAWLENLNIEGVIAQNDFNVQWSTKLTKASWISIINALSTTTSGLSITGSVASVKKAFETSEGANDGNTSAEWKTLTDTKKNWTISLV